MKTGNMQGDKEGESVEMSGANRTKFGEWRMG